MHFCYLDFIQSLAKINAANRGSITIQYRAMRCRLIHIFFKLNPFVKVHCDLQSSRIGLNLVDVQTAINLFKENKISPVKKYSQMSITNGITQTDKVKDFLDRAYSIEKEGYSTSLIVF